MKEKYGFIYLWFDRKHKRFYLGCHWGQTDDSYVCSSKWMMQAYKRRPQDFKRRLLISNISSKKEMFEKEIQFLETLKESEFGTRYYNLQCKSRHWSVTENAKTIGQRISASPNRNKNISKAKRGKTYVPSAKQMAHLKTLQQRRIASGTHNFHTNNPKSIAGMVPPSL